MYTAEMISSLEKNREYLNQIDQTELEGLMSEFDAYTIDSSSILNYFTEEHNCFSFESDSILGSEFFEHKERRSVTPNIETSKRTFREGPFFCAKHFIYSYI